MMLRLVKRLFSADTMGVILIAKARPVAKAAGLQVLTVPANDAAGLVEKVRAAAGNVLIVGHANTVPDLLKRLGVKQPVTIGEDDYDNLFVVVRHDSGEPALIRLRY